MINRSRQNRDKEYVLIGWDGDNINKLVFVTSVASIRTEVVEDNVSIIGNQPNHTFGVSGVNNTRHWVREMDDITKFDCNTDPFLKSIDISVLRKIADFDPVNSVNLETVILPTFNDAPITNIRLQGCLSIVGVLDFSGFTDLGGLLNCVSLSNSVTDFILPSSTIGTNPLYVQITNGAGLTGSLDFSPFVLQGVQLTSLINTTAFTFGTQAGLVVALQFNSLAGWVNVDVSGFSNLTTKIEILNLDAMTTLTMPSGTNTNVFTTFRINGNALLPSLDISAFENITGTLDLSHNISMTSLTLPTTSGIITWLQIFNSDLNGTLDISALNYGTGTSQIDITNANLTGITMPTTTANMRVGVPANDISTLDCSGITNMLSIDAKNNFNMTAVTLPTSSQVDYVSFAGCNALLTLDLSGFSNLSGPILLSSCNSLTALTLPNSSTLITKLDFENDTSVPNNLDVSNLTNISGEVRLVNMGGTNRTLTVTGNSNTFILFYIANGSWAYFDFFSVMTSAMEITNGYYEISNCGLSAAEVNQFLVDMDTNSTGGFTGRDIRIGGAGNSPPDTTSGGYDGDAAVTSLISKGFSVTTS